jgi:hypothetical protein
VRKPTINCVRPRCSDLAHPDTTAEARAAQSRFCRQRLSCPGWRLLAKAPANADVAQLVEHFTRNEGVSGSNPLVGFGATPTMAARRALLKRCGPST